MIAVIIMSSYLPRVSFEFVLLGAVRGATSRQSLGLLDTWLRLIKDVYRLHKEHLDMISNDEERHKRLVELNVVEQCLNLYKINVVQSKRFETSKYAVRKEDIIPRIHGSSLY